jgi:hypothetical protein
MERVIMRALIVPSRHRDSASRLVELWNSFAGVAHLWIAAHP